MGRMSGRRPASPPSPGPGRIGDLVLSWDTHTHQWTVGRLHGLPQLAWPTRQTAIEAIGTLARRERVDIWSRGPTVLTRLLTCRPPE